jgi:hypothetical protein
VAPTATPASTTSSFFPTPTPGGTAASGEVLFTFVIAQNSATQDAQGNYHATSADGTVYLSISAANAITFKVLRTTDSFELGTGQAHSGGTTAGSTIAFTKLNRAEGQQSLIFQVEATQADGSKKLSAPKFIQWPQQ